MNNDMSQRQRLDATWKDVAPYSPGAMLAYLAIYIAASLASTGALGLTRGTFVVGLAIVLVVVALLDWRSTSYSARLSTATALTAGLFGAVMALAAA